MKEIFTKQIIHKKTGDEVKIELQLSDESEESEVVRDFNKAIYNSTPDEILLERITGIEYAQKGLWGSVEGILDGEEIVYACSVKYCKPKFYAETPEVAAYPQGKGKVIQWSLILEAAQKDTPCTLEYYVFYRDTTGDICRLHPDEHELNITVPLTHPEAIYVELTISRADNRALGCGRYYLAFILHKEDGTYIDPPVIQFTNVVPAKGQPVQVESQLVGMEEVYRQMAALEKQKLFNENRLSQNLSPTPINLHAAVMGGKGSGKTSFARVLYDYYMQNGFITEGKLRIVNAAKWEKVWDNTSLISEAFSEAEKGMLYIENAASMIAQDARGNKELAAEELIRQLQTNTNDTCVVLADTPDRISQLLAIGDLQTYIGQVYKLPALTMEQMMEIADKECRNRSFILTDSAKNAIKSYLSSQPQTNATDMTRLIDLMIANMSIRVMNNTHDLFPGPSELSELKAEDVPQIPVGKYQVSISKLNELVGLKKLKYNIESHLSLVRFAQLRIRKGLQATIPPLHMIFSGNPGTGKTTVANLLGEIYASLGILKTGEVIMVDRKKLVGQYIGDTEENTKRALQQAHGNILFVDEAYNLVGDPDDKKDFGPKVLDCLLDELSKESTDMIIILAGYPDEMERLLRYNKGLQSRFPYTFHFEDYTEEELLEIAVLTARNSGYAFSEQALERLKGLIHRERERTAGKEQKHFGNARFITRLISTQIIPNMSRRVLAESNEDASSQFLSCIEAVDIPASVLDGDYTIDEALVARTLRQLDELIGRDEVKQTLRNLVNIARSKQRNGDDLSKTIPLQWTFTGATGTGKSSIARLLAQLLHAFHLITSDRMTQLRMPQTGHSNWSSYDIDRILRDTMKQFGQGLLFIDLDDVANSHIDIQWLRCKLTSLTAEMPGSYAFVIAVDDRKIQSQPIDMPISTSVIHFADYTPDELMAILVRRLTRNGFRISNDAALELSAHIHALDNNSGLANARTVKHIYTAVTSAAELRTMADTLTDEPVEITKEDVLSIKWRNIHPNRIGFDI